jgi:hypothetical protein
VMLFIVYRVHSWAGKLSGELRLVVEYVTSREEIQKVSFYIIPFRPMRKSVYVKRYFSVQNKCSVMNGMNSES